MGGRQYSTSRYLLPTMAMFSWFDQSSLLNRQRKLEEEKERKMLERAEAERRQKQEIQENKIRRVQLQESCNHFNGKNYDITERFFTKMPQIS